MASETSASSRSRAWQLWGLAVVGATAVGVLVALVMVAIPMGRMAPVLLPVIVLVGAVFGCTVGLGAASAAIPLYGYVLRKTRKHWLAAAWAFAASVPGPLLPAAGIASFMGWPQVLALPAIALAAAIGVTALCVVRTASETTHAS